MTNDKLQIRKQGFTLMNPTSERSERGFTLIELLVVISIIGILAAITLASFTTSQRQAKDTQRKSDLAQFRSSLESYANTNSGLYPSRTTGSGTDATAILCVDLGLTDCPSDPGSPTTIYKYQSDGTGSGSVTGTTYVIWATLESTPSTYWVVCSSGKSGKIVSSTSFSGGVCPSGLTQ